MTPDFDALLKALRAERKACNADFRRADPYGQGYKRGIERAIGAIEAAKKGQDPAHVLQTQHHSARLVRAVRNELNRIKAEKEMEK